MTSILQYGNTEIVIADPDEHTAIRDLIQSVVAEGRTEWTTFLCTDLDGNPQTYELLITPGVPVTIVSDAPVEATHSWQRR